VNKIDWINSYTIDISIVNSQAYFIKLNTFGKEYAAGSALFHWLLDETIIYNELNINIFYIIIKKLIFKIKQQIFIIEPFVI